MFWVLILFYVNILKKFFSGNSRVRLHAYFIAYLWARIVKRLRPPRFRMKLHRASLAVGMPLHSQRIIKKFYLQHFLRSCVAHSASFRYFTPPTSTPLCVYYSHEYANDTVPLWFHNQVEDPVGFRAFHLMHSLDFNGMHKLHGLKPELTVKLATSAQLLLHLTSFNYRRPGTPTRNPTSFTSLTKSLVRIAKKNRKL